MCTHVRPALSLLLVFSGLLGLGYPALVTLVAQRLFPVEANGSILRVGDRTVGSALVGQTFTGARYFWSRPSATRPASYDAAASGGSNLGPTNPMLAAVVAARAAALHAVDPGAELPIPADLVTASGSGLDPHISPRAAAFQMARVARARGLDLAVVRRLVQQHTEGWTVPGFSQQRVNVVRLNLELDRLAPAGQ